MCIRPHPSNIDPWPQLTSLTVLFEATANRGQVLRNSRTVPICRDRIAAPSSTTWMLSHLQSRPVGYPGRGSWPPAKAPPSGLGWLDECILARRDKAGFRLITRHGNDFTSRLPFIAMAVGKLPFALA